jgi:hypothetical protein
VLTFTKGKIMNASQPANYTLRPAKTAYEESQANECQRSWFSQTDKDTFNECIARINKASSLGVSSTSCPTLDAHYQKCLQNQGYTVSYQRNSGRDEVSWKLPK